MLVLFSPVIIIIITVIIQSDSLPSLFTNLRREFITLLYSTTTNLLTIIIHQTAQDFTIQLCTAICCIILNNSNVYLSTNSGPRSTRYVCELILRGAETFFRSRGKVSRRSAEGARRSRGERKKEIHPQ